MSGLMYDKLCYIVIIKYKSGSQGVQNYGVDLVSAKMAVNYYRSESKRNYVSSACVFEMIFNWSNDNSSASADLTMVYGGDGYDTTK